MTNLTFHTITAPAITGPATDPVERFYQAVEQGRTIDPATFTDDVVFDATVPGWRYHKHGARPVAQELGRWFADPGRFEEMRRTPLPNGELVEFTLSWHEHGVPHACHQAHVVEFAADDRRIARLTAWCGGRWPAQLLAEMAEADNTAGE